MSISGIYQERCLPHLTNLVCGSRVLARQRELVVPAAEGRVLEVGMGTALNLPYYDRSRVTHLWGLEPSQGMRRVARKNVEGSGMEVEWLDLPAAEIPLESGAADTVVLTFTLCSIPDWEAALQEMRRVLRPGGKLLFCEHGAAPDKSVLTWQQRITPWWKRIAGGCHLDRPIPRYLQTSGFEIVKLETGYLDAVPRIAGFIYRGTARRA
jgi:ubiquinone/menaquinone biosynthesis C-methylase UbiE